MDEKMNLVSVIIPVFNGERFILNAIESVLNQTYDNLEVIVVDDASTDSTQKIVKSIGDHRIKYIRNEKNMERAFSRNRGVEVARGEFVFFLDYDDMWKPDYVETVLNSFESGFEIVYSVPREFINESGNIIRKSSKRVPEEIPSLIFSGMIGYPSSTAVLKRRFIKYKSKYIPREDWEFYIRSFLQGIKIAVRDNSKVLIREHGNRTSTSVRLMKSTLKVFDDYKNKIPNEYMPYIKFHTGLMCLRFGNLLEGWSKVLSAVIDKPSLLINLRNIVYAIKWGTRVDRWYKFKADLSILP